MQAGRDSLRQRLEGDKRSIIGNTNHGKISQRLVVGWTTVSF